MSETEYLNGITILVTLGLFFVFFYWLWQQLVVDTTRQRLFELRDQLFDIAARGDLSFEDEVYVVVRHIFNNTIRYAHDLDWFHIVAYLFFAKRKRGEIKKSALKVEHLIKDIKDENVRRDVQKVVNQMHITTALHIYKRSLVLMALIPLVVVLATIFTASAGAVTKLYRRYQIIFDARAYSELHC